MELHGAYRRPALGNGTGASPPQHRLRRGGGAVGTHEGLSGGVEALEGPVGPEHRVMVPALPVFRLMIDRAGLHLHLAGGKIALKISAVVHRVPEAELHKREDLQRLSLPGAVL